MNKNRFSESEIIRTIQAGGPLSEKMVKVLYDQHRAKAIAYIRKNSGNKADAKDIYQDAIVALYQNIKAGKFNMESALSSYLFGIIRQMWLNRLKRKGIEGNYLKAQESQKVSTHEIPDFEDPNQTSTANTLLNLFGEPCRTVLTYAIFYEYSMHEIAQQLGFKNEQVARNKKYKCLKQLTAFLKEKPTLIKLLKEQI